MPTDPSRDPLREQLAQLVDCKEAHAGFDKAVEGQADILDFSVNASYVHMKWPDAYWPVEPAPLGPEAWARSVAAYRADRETLKALARNPSIDLFARIPHGDGQTCLREILLVVDHGAYHVGQLVSLRRALGCW